MHEGENMWEYEHCTLSKGDGSSDSLVPSAIEFIKWSNKEIHFAVLKSKLLGLDETVHGKEDDN